MKEHASNRLVMLGTFSDQVSINNRNQVKKNNNWLMISEPITSKKWPLRCRPVRRGLQVTFQSCSFPVHTGSRAEERSHRNEAAGLHLISPPHRPGSLLSHRPIHYKSTSASVSLTIQVMLMDLFLKLKPRFSE